MSEASRCTLFLRGAPYFSILGVYIRVFADHQILSHNFDETQILSHIFWATLRGGSRENRMEAVRAEGHGCSATNYPLMMVILGYHVAIFR